MSRWTMNYTAHLGLRSPDAPLFRHSAASASPVDQIAFLADLGFAGVQDIFLKFRSPEEQVKIGKALTKHGLVMGSFNNNPLAWDRPLWSRSDVDAQDELSRDFDASVTAAERSGGRFLTCVTASDPGRPKELQLSTMADNLQRFADRAARKDLILLIEPVAQAWIPGMLVDSLVDAHSIVSQVNHPAVRLLFDIAHVEMRDGDAFSQMKTAWDLIGLIQAAGVPARIELGLDETIDWPAVFRWIKNQNYNGLIELEHLPAEETAKGEQDFIERLCKIDMAI